MTTAGSRPASGVRDYWYTGCGQGARGDLAFGEPLRSQSGGGEGARVEGVVKTIYLGCPSRERGGGSRKSLI